MENENLYVLDIFPSRKRKWAVSTNMSQLPHSSRLPLQPWQQPLLSPVKLHLSWDGMVTRVGGGFPCRLSREEFLCKYAQLCPTLCDPTDYSPTRLLCPPNPPSKNPGVGCHSLLQGIFPNQGLNPRLLHCRQILYHLSHQGSPSTNY